MHLYHSLAGNSGCLAKATTAATAGPWIELPFISPRQPVNLPLALLHFQLTGVSLRGSNKVFTLSRGTIPTSFTPPNRRQSTAFEPGPNPKTHAALNTHYPMTVRLRTPYWWWQNLPKEIKTQYNADKIKQAKPNIWAWPNHEYVNFREITLPPLH